MTWTATSTGHEVSLVDGKVVSRNSAGKALRAVPGALKDDPAVLGLRQLADWLKTHDAASRSAVEEWMVRSLPVPLAVLREVWPDPSWQRALRDLVVAPYDAPAGDAGLLRAVDERGAGVVTLDGDTVWLSDRTVAVPHPIMLSDLAELRGFAIELGVEQVVQQLFRETWERPPDADLTATSLTDWSGGAFAQLRHLTGRVMSSGYAVRGGFAVLKLYEGEPIEARVWVGEGAPDEEAETGDLFWLDARGGVLPLGAVGPVAWSEGARMAARIYAGRVVDDETA